MMQRIITDLASQLGMATAMVIARKWGGHALHVPKSIPADHPIALSLGHEAATRLAEVFGGQRIELPLERHALRLFRDAEIRKALAPESEGGLGMTQSACGRLFGMSRQSVAFIAQRAERGEGA
jgi:Mor family transcriptional regulator